MDKLRILYEQTGRAVWCSHLDMMRTLQRALNRAHVPLRYSEGFNPHALLSILMPLSVGTGSLCQMADIRVLRELDLAALPEQLTAVLPEGVRVRECRENGAGPAEMKWLRVSGLWRYGDAEAARRAAEACTALFAAGPVSVQRKTKRGEGTLELTEHVRELAFAPEAETVRVRALVSAAEPVVNPDLLTAAVSQCLPEAAPVSARFCREELYQADMSVFR